MIGRVYRGCAQVRVIVAWPSFTERPTVAEKAHDIVHGLRSGIPPCCVLFFVDEWPAVPLFVRRRWFESEPLSTQYVRCPACRQHNGAAMPLRRSSLDRRRVTQSLVTRQA